MRQDSPAPAIETAEIFVPALILQIGQAPPTQNGEAALVATVGHIAGDSIQA